MCGSNLKGGKNVVVASEVRDNHKFNSYYSNKNLSNFKNQNITNSNTLGSKIAQTRKSKAHPKDTYPTNKKSTSHEIDDWIVVDSKPITENPQFVDEYIEEEFVFVQEKKPEKCKKKLDEYELGNEYGDNDSTVQGLLSNY